MSGDARTFWDAIDRDPSRPGRPHPHLVEQLAGGRDDLAAPLGIGLHRTLVAGQAR
jgi:hypothetical protein